MDLNTLDLTKGGTNLLSVKTWIGVAATVIVLGVAAVGVMAVKSGVENLGVIEGMQGALSGLGR